MFLLEKGASAMTRAHSVKDILSSWLPNIRLDLRLSPLPCFEFLRSSPHQLPLEVLKALPMKEAVAFAVEVCTAHLDRRLGIKDLFLVALDQGFWNAAKRALSSPLSC